MKKIACLLLLTALPVGAWAAECSQPRSPDRMPDGNSATREEMVAAKRVVDQYQADVKTFLDCIKVAHEAQLATEGPNLSASQKERMINRYEQQNDRTYDAAQEVAAKFNEQIRVFRAKNPN